MFRRLEYLFGLFCFALVAGCATIDTISVQEQQEADEAARAPSAEYRIGPGDQLNIFVWQHPDVSVTVPVRPDGKISIPLVEDMPAEGKTPTALAAELEKELSKYIRNPVVNVVVTNFVGRFSEQIRVVGQAANPSALPYREGITVLDVMIEVGGLGEFAAGNRAKIVRKTGANTQEIRVRLNDLLDDGEMGENIKMRPGDVLIIPETYF